MANEKSITVGIVAGELSGDILGAGLIKALKKRFPNAQFVGIAGPKMQAQGCKSLFDMEELAVMGLVEVLGRLPRLLKIRKELVNYFIQNPPDVFIGVDAPDFNLRVEKPLKAAGIKTIQYVSPSVWAWRPKRIHTIAEATNLVLSLLPFEKAFYDKYDVPCTFVGHTLADEIPLESDTLAARKEIGLKESDTVLALLPGSRGSEVGLLSETYLQTAKQLVDKMPDLKIVVPLVNEKRKKQFTQILDKVAPELRPIILDGQSSLAMTASDAVLLASGTATLEAMLYKKPMVVGYRLKTLSYKIFSTFFTFNIKHFSLPNLLADAPLVAEFLQEDCNPDALTDALLPLLRGDNSALIERFYEIHKGIRLNASEQAAIAVAEVIDAN
ncbi:lipid-A-disaccharide synthase [Pseudoalteromonas luteoviolacea]|uniref:Lipid-A-disaccharide synthase n=1 Tax=Pseudoalteromonas luteoviolacea H33 TaxID=1365251 RepID=A0A167DGT3_9GAMM|nr:lipid-A-disaccharide synthase [Pseudoalteromonas luteoviolacea]KZN48824.1 lipid-A-disaccharide synthase [Pseudoalteromonas luteoviolacea H33]KZN72861.1 lipid-A-disaccharide synthase [Pseudoalteromonas luteoviolacea H33-S]MBQ4880017.1 lipid-A-disaccharide synthase [Pseudoalteromonas luteoviolacea]MBQ4909034.1 lipid-A-disaccharide synthase [Pseudoalteromonas luteoviolacea]